MSAAIKHKLYELKEKVEKLEAAAKIANGKVDQLKSRPAPQAPAAKQQGGVKQADMFTVFTGGQQKETNVAMKSMASRLDATIEKVEELLRQ